MLVQLASPTLRTLAVRLEHIVRPDDLYCLFVQATLCLALEHLSLAFCPRGGGAGAAGVLDQDGKTTHPWFLLDLPSLGFLSLDLRRHRGLQLPQLLKTLSRPHHLVVWYTDAIGMDHAVECMGSADRHALRVRALHPGEDAILEVRRAAMQLDNQSTSVTTS